MRCFRAMRLFRAFSSCPQRRACPERRGSAIFGGYLPFGNYTPLKDNAVTSMRKMLVARAVREATTPQTVQPVFRILRSI